MFITLGYIYGIRQRARLTSLAPGTHGLLAPHSRWLIPICWIKLTPVARLALKVYTGARDLKGTCSILERGTNPWGLQLLHSVSWKLDTKVVVGQRRPYPPEPCIASDRNSYLERKESSKARPLGFTYKEQFDFRHAETSCELPNIPLGKLHLPWDIFCSPRLL